MTKCTGLTPTRGLAALALVTSTVVFAGPSVDAQESASLDLISQTLYVDENPAEIVVRVVDAPASGRLRLTIYDTPDHTREAVRDRHETPPVGGGRIADFGCSLDGDCFGQAMMTAGPDDTFTVTLDDTEIGEILRAEPGVLPFVIRLVDDEGRSLDAMSTSLIVSDPEPTDSPVEPVDRVRVAFLAQVLAPVARQADLEIDLDTDAVLSAADPLAAFPDLPITTEIIPETLDALSVVDPPALEALLEILDGRPLLRGPWVDLDEEAWRLADESDQVVAHYARGNDTIEDLVGMPPTGLVRLDPDARPETLTLLRSAGATAVVVDDAQLSSTTLATDPDQPFQLLDANGVAITALRFDEALHDTLDHPDPELAAVRAIAELVALTDEATTDLGVLLDLGRIDPATLDLFLDGLFLGNSSRDASLGVVNVVALAEGELAQATGGNLRGELLPTETPDVRDLAADLESATVGVATLARMVEPEIDALVPLIDLLQVAVATNLGDATAEDYLARITTEINDLRSGIEILDGERVTLTDRSADLPLTVVNRQSLPLNVELVLTAEKIRFPDGDRIALTLEPGETHITIPVETLASGDARITATIVSPGGFFELSNGTVDIRSTAISGLGLLISVLALLVLGVWWIRTILRVRRNRGAATVSAESEEGET